MTTDIIGMFRQIVGNHVAHAALYHNAESGRTADEIRGIQQKVLGNLEE